MTSARLATKESFINLHRCANLDLGILGGVDPLRKFGSIRIENGLSTVHQQWKDGMEGWR